MARAGNDRVVASGRQGRDPVVSCPPRGELLRRAAVDASRQDGERLVAEEQVDRVDFGRVHGALAVARRKILDLRDLRLADAREGLQHRHRVQKHVVRRGARVPGEFFVRVGALTRFGRSGIGQFALTRERKAVAQALEPLVQGADNGVAAGGEKFRREVRDQYIVSALRAKTISPEKIIISPYKVETYYLAHQDDFKVEDEVKLRMIVLNKISSDDTNTVRLAGEILAQIKGGATFQEMASVYSQDSQRSQGGDRGWIERSVLRKELADIAFALKPGQVSEVIDMPEACYIMLVEQLRPAHVKPLNEVRDDVELTLRTQAQKQLEQQWIAQLKKKTFIRLF